MRYFHYHGLLRKRIREGHLRHYEYRDNYHDIAPALLLYFDDGSIKPVREYRFQEYSPLLQQWEENYAKIKKREEEVMGYRAVNHSVSVITIEKDNQQAGMTCAWGMQVDYDKMLFLLGSQSDTATLIRPGDRLGISVLSRDQKDLAEHFGGGHSLHRDKFIGVEISRELDVITLPHSAREIEAEVISLYHLPEIEEDLLVYVKILKHRDRDLEILSMKEF